MTRRVGLLAAAALIAALVVLAWSREEAPMPRATGLAEPSAYAGQDDRGAGGQRPSMALTASASPDGEQRTGTPTAPWLEPAYRAWSTRIGINLPDHLERLDDAELQRRADAGDWQAAQALARRLGWARGDLDAAREYFLMAAEHGSVGAPAELANLLYPNDEFRAAFEDRHDREMPVSPGDAYAWARVAVMRGDATALLLLNRIARDIGHEEALIHEALALRRHADLQQSHQRRTGTVLETEYNESHQALTEMLLATELAREVE